MKTKIFSLAACSLFLLSACDKGKASLDRIIEAYPGPLKGSVTMENLEDTKMAMMALSVVKTAHHGKGSGDKAAEMLEEMKGKIAKVQAEMAPVLDAKEREMQVPVGKLMVQTDQIQKQVRAWKRKNGTPRTFPFKAGDCVATDSGEEFDNKLSLFEVEILRVEKVGEENVLLKALYRAKEDDVFSVKWKDALDRAEPEEVAKALVEDGMKLNCVQAEKLAEEFHSCTAKGAEFKELAEKVGWMSHFIGQK